MSPGREGAAVAIGDAGGGVVQGQIASRADPC